MAIVELPRADDDADPLVPELDEMLRRKPAGFFIVDDDRAKSVIAAPGQNDGNVGGFSNSQVAAGRSAPTSIRPSTPRVSSVRTASASAAAL